MSGSTVKIKHGVAAVINTTAVDTEEVAGVLAKNPELKSISDALGGWVERIRTPPNGRGGRRNRIGGLLDRDRWLSPVTTYDKIRLAREAPRDDIVGTALDGTEAFALSRIGVYADDSDQEDFWNEWAGSVNLDDQLRKMWRILFTDSQAVCVTWWNHKSFQLPGRTPKGNQRRKTFDNMLVPVGMTFLDATKVTPIGLLMFGQERLAYVPGPQEGIRIDQRLFLRDNPGATLRDVPGWMRYPTPSGGSRIVRVPAGQRAITAAADDRVGGVVDGVEVEDALIDELFLGRYTPDAEEARLLQEDGVDISHLFEFRPGMVFRHCLTRPDYQRFSDVRLESIFELLDLKAQLRQLDRVVLVGGSHFIVLITKGTDQLPAQQPEIDALKAQAFTLATIPVIVGDHRLKVEIITPKVDHTLDRTKWDTLDDGIFARVWSTFKHDVSRTEDPLKTAMIIAKNLESRRQMMRRTIEREIFDRIRRYNSAVLTDRAKLVFTPAKITMAFDAAWASFLMDLRASNEISRNTILGQFDLDQEDEARMRKREKTEFDSIFQTQDPHGTPNPMNNGNGNAPDPGSTDPAEAKAGQRAAGRAAKGGGTSGDGSGRGKPARRPRHKANPDTPVEAAKSMYEMGRDELIELAADYEIVGRHKMRKPWLIREIRAAQLGLNPEEIDDEVHDDD